MVTITISYNDCVPHMNFGNNLRHSEQRIPAVWQADILLMA